MGTLRTNCAIEAYFAYIEPFLHSDNLRLHTTSSKNGKGCRRAKAAMAACDCLTTRQQQILSLCRQGYSIGEIAEEMGLTKAQVSDEKYKAIKKLRERLVA